MYEEWENLQALAKQNMTVHKGTEGALIEAAAQHPLVDGEYPNEKFTKRLLLAVSLYHQIPHSKIYVPGSLHTGDKLPTQGRA